MVICFMDETLRKDVSGEVVSLDPAPQGAPADSKLPCRLYAPSMVPFKEFPDFFCLFPGHRVEKGVLTVGPVPFPYLHGQML